MRHHRTWIVRTGLAALIVLQGLTGILTDLPAQARSAATPWTMDQGFQNLVYGATTGADLLRIVGAPDEIIRQEQMSPVIENYYYYAPGGSGAATVFVLENGLLAGLYYKSAGNQIIDITYFLQDNGDKNINYEILGNMQGYYPGYPMYWLNSE